MNPEDAFVVPADDAAELIGRICARDQHALGRLYDLTADRVYGVALRGLGNVHDAEEIVCDVFQQVWQRAAQFVPERDTALRWLLAIAYSRGLDASRRLRPARLSQPLHPQDTDGAYTNDETHPVDKLLDALPVGTAVHPAMSELGEEQRGLIGLAFFQGLSHSRSAPAPASPSERSSPTSGAAVFIGWASAHRLRTD